MLAIGIITTFAIIQYNKPYLVVNGLAEDKSEYDPAVFMVEDSVTSLLAEVDSKVGLLAVEERAGTTIPTYASNSETLPTKISGFQIQSGLHVQTEDDALKTLGLVLDYYLEKGYIYNVDSNNYMSPEEATEAGYSNLTHDPASVKPKDLVNQRRSLKLDLPFNALQALTDNKSSVTAHDNTTTHGYWDLSYSDFWDRDSMGGVTATVLLYDDTYVVDVVSHVDGIALANIPKFEGNLKENSTLKPEWVDILMTGESVCPLEPNSFVGGWRAEYGCMPN